MPEKQLTAKIKAYQKSGGGGEGDSRKNAYSSLVKIQDHTYRTVYDEIDYLKAYEFFNKLKPTPRTFVGKPNHQYGACNAFVKGNLVGDTFDWNYDESAFFEIHTPAVNGRKSVIGLCRKSDLLAADVESGKYSDKFDILPFELVRGFNTDGLAVITLVMPNDKGVTYGTTPLSTLKETVSETMLPRFILDKFSTVDDAIDYIKEHVSVFAPTPLVQMGYEQHYMIIDRTKSVVLEFVGNAPVVIESDKCTNFVLDGTETNKDGSVYTPATQDADHDAIKTNLITEYGSGLERWNVINAALPTIREGDMDAFQALLISLMYSKTYDRTTDPFRYTEYVGGEYTCATPIEVFDAKDGIVEKAIAEFEKRDRKTGKTWHSVSGAVIDLENLEMHVVFQEDLTKLHTVGFNYYTKQEVDRKISQIGGGNLKYSESQQLTTAEKDQLQQNMDTGARFIEEEQLETYLEVTDQDVPFDTGKQQYIIERVDVGKGFSTGDKYQLTLTLGRDQVVVSGTATDNYTLACDDNKSEFGVIDNVFLNSTDNLVVITFKESGESMPNLTQMNISLKKLVTIIIPFREELIGLKSLMGYDPNAASQSLKAVNGEIQWVTDRE